MSEFFSGKSLELEYDRLPCECCKGSLRRYFEHGIHTGDSLYAVLVGDLWSAVGRLDENHWDNLKEIMRWIYNEMPAMCNGSRDNVNTWIEKGGARNMKEYQHLIDPPIHYDIVASGDESGIRLEKGDKN